MIERQLEITNRLGLHARAAAKLVQTASSFSSDVILVRNGEEVDAKSILGILLIAAAQGTSIVVRCAGEDEEAALKSVASLIENRFGEES